MTPLATIYRALKLNRLAVAACVTLLVTSSLAHAAPEPGTLDNSFSSDGWTRFDFGRHGEIANAVTIHKDGKIIVAGFSDDRIAVARLLPNGQLDTTFSDDGKSTLLLDGAQPNNVTTDPNGNIYVTGRFHTGDSENLLDFFLARFTAGGAPDTNFGGDGAIVEDLGNFDVPEAVYFRKGKIWVVGSTDHNGAILRYKPNGMLDTNVDGDPAVHWSEDGKLVFDLPKTEVIMGLRFVSDEIVEAAGYQRGNTTTEFLLTRLSAQGVVDTNFGTAGFVTPEFMPQPFGMENLVVTNQGYVVDAFNTDGDWIIRKYTKSGAVVETWGTDGIAAIDLPPEVQPREIAVQADGDVVGAGAFWNIDFGKPIRPIVVRVTEGLLDVDFGTATVRFPTTLEERWSAADDVAIGTDGKIVIAGMNAFSGTQESPRFDMIVARVHSGACGILGTRTADDLSGTPADDVICGSGGSDEISGLGGNDRLLGGDGADNLDGGRGTDVCIGGDGTDTVSDCEN